MHKKDSLDFAELPLSNFLVTNILTVIMRGYLPSTGRGDASIDETSRSLCHWLRPSGDFLCVCAARAPP